MSGEKSFQNVSISRCWSLPSHPRYRLSSFSQYIDGLKESEKDASKSQNAKSLAAENEKIEKEIEALKAQIAQAQREKVDLHAARREFTLKVHSTKVLSESLSAQLNQLESEHTAVVDQITSIDENIKISIANFDRYKQINALNDAFYVWYTGPFATINAFKLGNLVNKPVESTEINAALGQAALVLNIIASRCGIQFKQFHIAPMGSFPRILKADDRRTSYPLFIDQGSFSLFPKRNFNLALSGFMQCIFELGEYITAYDPTLSIPYKIEVADSKIADKSFVYGGDEEVWTHALKHMLANIKWIIAWYCKHGHY
jgi:beclin 1